MTKHRKDKGNLIFNGEQDLLKGLSSKERQVLMEVYSEEVKEDSTPKIVEILNELILMESSPILNNRGQSFSVKSGKIDRRTHKVGQCYSNSVKMMIKGYWYVEGYVINKSTGYKTGHSWNIDRKWNHIDFTFDDSEQYDYFGVFIPNWVVLKYGKKKDGSFSPVLPQITEDLLPPPRQKTPKS